MRVVAALAVAAALVMGGCSDDEKPDGATSSTESSDATSEAPVVTVNLCNELVPAALAAITGVDFQPGQYDGTKCVWQADGDTRLAMAVLQDPLLGGWFVVVENKGGTDVKVGNAVRASASINPEGSLTHVNLAVETHPGIGLSVTLVTPSATVDQAIRLAEQVLSSAGY